MAVLNSREKRRARARKHADYPHDCPFGCGRFFGNGGWSSHKRMHVRQWVARGRPTTSLATDEILVRWEKGRTR